MPENRHMADRLGALLAGTLAEDEAAEVRRHLASCASCAGERDLLQQAAAIVPRLPAADPRPGFAVRVAARAGELHPRPLGAPWWRWAFGGGLAVAAAAAAALLVARPATRAPAEELLVAQRLDLFEDLSVVQNQDALRDLDVVAVLHTLGPEEGKP
jgi:anti-sigma factor RsiW